MKLRILMLAALSIALVACGGRYGGITLDMAAEQGFLSGTVKPNLTYYTFGSSAAPGAVIGVDKGFVLANTDMWYPLTPQTSENLRALTRMMYDRYRADKPDVTLRGFRMVDQNGRYVGDWYSAWGTTTTVKSDENNRVTIYQPSLPNLQSGSDGINMRRHR